MMPPASTLRLDDILWTQPEAPQGGEAQPSTGQGQDAPIRFRSKDDAAPQPGAAPQQGTETAQPPRSGPPPGLGCGYEQILMLVAMIAIFYFLLVRPTQKQEKVRREMLGNLKKGDRVVTSGGIHGVVASLGNDTASLRVDSEGKIKLTVDRSAIAKVVQGEPPKPEAEG
jgi:preprotein translocase subunit YajC